MTGAGGRGVARRAGGDRGSVTAWLMVVPVLVLLLGAVTIDLWSALSVRTRLAAIADDAAAAGATVLDQQALRGGSALLSAGAATDAATAAVAVHADADLVLGMAVDAAPERVQVVVEGIAPLPLLGMVGIAEVPVTAEGAATPVLRDP